MCIDSDDDSFIRVNSCDVFHRLTLSTGKPLKPKDILKQVMVTADTKLVTAITESSEGEQPINRLVVQAHCRGDCSAYAVLQMFSVRVAVVIPV